MRTPIGEALLAAILAVMVQAGVQAQTESQGSESMASEEAAAPLLQDGDHVLFIGNSCVGSEGGLQNHFRRTVAKADPRLTIETHWPNMFGMPSLEAMDTEEVVSRIRSGEDQLVIFMNGTDEKMREFAELIRSSGSEAALFLTWAGNPAERPDGMGGFRADTGILVEQARRFEADTGVAVIPSALIYYDLLADPVDFKGLRSDYLFVPGGSAQNDLGTLVNVAAIYAVTTGRSPVGLPLWDPFPRDLVQAIEERVWEIVQAWQSGETELKPAESQDTGKMAKAATDAAMEPAWSPLVEDGDRIFYVGNSFIGSEGGMNNHLRRLMAAADPPLRITDDSRIFWGQGLGSMDTPEVFEEIQNGDWDIVVVTSGWPETLGVFEKAIREAGSQMIIHMTWGRNPVINDGGMAQYRSETERIFQGMKQFEEETGVPVVPCGLIFYDLIVDPPDVRGLRTDWVYMVENIHQNHIGTMANAAAHYAVLTGRSPVGLPMWDPYPPELVRAVQERAWQIVKDWKAGRAIVKPLPE